MPAPHPPPRRGLVLPAVLALVVLLALAGCADRGREMRPPRADQTTTTGVPAGAGAAEESRPAASAGPGGFTVRIDGVAAGDPLPSAMTCEGADEAPTLLWQNVPSGTTELAVSMTDVTDGDVHWLVVGIDPTLAGIDGQDLPSRADALLTTSGVEGWAGPCAPTGEARDYVFTLYALGEPTSFDPLADPATVLSDLAGGSLGVTTTTATYTATTGD